MSDEAELRALEDAAFRAWPAAEVEELDGFRLRATSGVTRRANSVWTSGERAFRLPLEQRIERAEQFYEARGLACCFQLTPLSEPGLDAVLAARGYELDAPVAIELASATELAARPADARVRVERQLGAAWFEVSAAKGRFADAQATYRGLLERLGARADFALAELDAEPVAVALGVADGDWYGVFSMLTLPSARRRGLGSALLRALARAALERGASRLYLQVERDNASARSLYAAHGFRERYGYHYRVRRRAQSGM